MHTGSCLCEGVAFTIRGPLEPIQVCHCRQCRTAQGTPFATNIPVSTSALTLLRGEELLQGYESSPGKLRVFCKRCGSPIFSKREDKPDTLRIRAGIIDGNLDTTPIAHFYTADQANWWPLHDDLPKFAKTHTPTTTSDT